MNLTRKEQFFWRKVKFFVPLQRGRCIFHAETRQFQVGRLEFGKISSIFLHFRQKIIIFATVMGCLFTLNKRKMAKKFELMSLPYALDALEPVI
ncbi:MAG: hypothetical protein IKS36_03320, partial [Bacteroidales bacterium]|nr:hypothetical protein [Bacteroidales bacterium]